MLDDSGWESGEGGPTGVVEAEAEAEAEEAEAEEAEAEAAGSGCSGRSRRSEKRLRLEPEERTTGLLEERKDNAGEAGLCRSLATSGKSISVGASA